METSLVQNAAYINCFPAFMIKSEDEAAYSWFDYLAANLGELNITPFFDLNGLNLPVFQAKLSEYPDYQIYNSHANQDFKLIKYLSDEKAASSDFVSFTDSDSKKNFNISILTDKLSLVVRNKTALISQKIDSIKSSTMNSSQTLKHIEISIKYLNLALSFQPLMQSPLTDVIFSEIYKLCLLSEVEINYALHPQIDPVFGWIDAPKDFKTDLVKFANPFLNFEILQNGIIKTIDYFPRKISLNLFEPFVYFTTSEDPTIQSSTSEPDDVEPVLMRRSPDINAVKFSEKVKLNETSSLQIYKTFYIHSGLVPVGNYSTTGYHFDFWAESEANFEADLKNRKLALMMKQYFQCDSSLIRLRALTEMGGISDKVFELNGNDKLTINDDLIDGGLQGVRLIDSVNQLVVDYRFSKVIKEICFTGEDFTPINSSILKFTCSFEVQELFDQKLLSMNVSIY